MDFANYIYDIKSGKKMFNRPKPVTRTYKSPHEAYSQWLNSSQGTSIHVGHDDTLDIDKFQQDSVEIDIPDIFVDNFVIPPVSVGLPDSPVFFLPDSFAYERLVAFCSYNSLYYVAQNNVIYICDDSFNIIKTKYTGSSTFTNIVYNPIDMKIYALDSDTLCSFSVNNNDSPVDLLYKESVSISSFSRIVSCSGKYYIYASSSLNLGMRYFEVVPSKDSSVSISFDSLAHLSIEKAIEYNDDSSNVAPNDVRYSISTLHFEKSDFLGKSFVFEKVEGYHTSDKSLIPTSYKFIVYNNSNFTFEKFDLVFPPDVLKNSLYHYSFCAPNNCFYMICKSSSVHKNYILKFDLSTCLFSIIYTSAICPEVYTVGGYYAGFTPMIGGIVCEPDGSYLYMLLNTYVNNYGQMLPSGFTLNKFSLTSFSIVCSTVIDTTYYSTSNNFVFKRNLCLNPNTSDVYFLRYLSGGNGSTTSTVVVSCYNKADLSFSKTFPSVSATYGSSRIVGTIDSYLFIVNKEDGKIHLFENSSNSYSFLPIPSEMIFSNSFYFDTVFVNGYDFIFSDPYFSKFAAVNLYGGSVSALTTSITNQLKSFSDFYIYKGLLFYGFLVNNNVVRPFFSIHDLLSTSGADASYWLYSSYFGLGILIPGSIKSLQSKGPSDLYSLTTYKEVNGNLYCFYTSSIVMYNLSTKNSIVLPSSYAINSPYLVTPCFDEYFVFSSNSNLVFVSYKNNTVETLIIPGVSNILNKIFYICGYLYVTAYNSKTIYKISKDRVITTISLNIPSSGTIYPVSFNFIRSKFLSIFYLYNNYFYLFCYDVVNSSMYNIFICTTTEFNVHSSYDDHVFVSTATKEFFYIYSSRCFLTVNNIIDLVTPFKIGLSNKTGCYFPIRNASVIQSLKHIDSTFGSDISISRPNIPALIFSKLLNQTDIHPSINFKYFKNEKSFLLYAECYKVTIEGSSSEYSLIGSFAFRVFKNSDSDKGHMEVVFLSKSDPSRSYGLFEFDETKTSSIVAPDNAQFFPESVETDKVYSYSTIPTYTFVSSVDVIKDIATGKPISTKPKKVSHTYTSASDAYSKWKVGNFSSAVQNNLLSTDDGSDSYVFDNNILLTPSTVGKIGFSSENGLHIYLNPGSSNEPSFTLGGSSVLQYFPLGAPSLSILFKKPGSDSKSYNGTYISIPDGFIMFCQFSRYSGANYRVDVAVKITKGGVIEVVTSSAESGTYLGFLCSNQTNGVYNKTTSESNGGFEVLLTDSVTCYRSDVYNPFSEEVLHKVPSTVTIYNGGEFVVNSDNPNIRFFENSSDNFLRLFLNLENVDSTLYKVLLAEYGVSFADDVSSNKTSLLKNSVRSVENKAYINSKPIFTYRNLNFLKYFRYDLFFNNNGKFELLSSNNTSINIKFPDYIFKTSGSKVFSIKLFFPNNVSSKTYFYEKEFTIKCLPSTAFNLPVVNAGNNLTFTFDSYSVVLKSTDYGKFIVSSITNTDDNTTITKLKYRKTNSSNPFDVFEVGSEVSFIELINGVNAIQTNEDFSFNLTDSLEVYDPTNSNADSLSLNSALNNIKFLPNLYYDCTAHNVYSNSYIVGNTPYDLITTKFKNKPLFFFFVIRGKFSSDFKVVDDSGTSVDYIVDSKDSNLHFVYLNILKDKNYYYYNKGFKIPVMASFVSDEYYYNFTLPVGSYSIKFEEPTFIGLFNCELNNNIKASFTLVDGSIITKSVNPNTPAYVYSLVKDISFFDDDSSPLGSENLTFVNHFPLTHDVSGANVLEKSLEDIVYMAKSVRDYDIPEDSVLQNETLYAVENGKLVEYEDGYIYSLATDDLLSYSNPFDRVEYTSKSKAFGYKVPSSTSPKLINLFNRHFKTIGLPIVKE